jgi:ABC-type polysaccharide/polyol phosphate export permease
VPITWAWVGLPIVVVLQVMFTYGVVLLASATAVKYRDLLHVIPNILMVLFFTSPVLYPQANVPPEFRFLLDYNPLSYLVEAYHQILFDGVMLPPLALGRLLIFGVAALALGMWVFDGRRDHFAESI